jgi:transposase
MVLVDGKGLPLGISLESATPAEVKLAPHIKREVRGRPKHLIADRAYDSNPFRAALASLGTEPVIPRRRNNRRATHQDGRKLRRYRHRWLIERTFSWLGWCRRLVVRWDRQIEMYRGFFHIALIMLTLRRVLK